MASIAQRNAAQRNGPQRNGARSRYYIPVFGRLYDGLGDVAWLLLRLVVGFSLVPHGMQKLFGAFNGPGMARVAANFAQQGFNPPTLFAWAVALTELVGGTLLAIGLFTRPAALAITIFLGTAVTVHYGRGFFWTAGGFEFPLMWAVAALFFLIRGGGPLSIDRALSREF